MHYVYVLRDRKYSQLYYGYTADLEKNLSNNQNAVIYYEAYLSEKDAKRRERKLKHYGQSRTHLKNRIKSSCQLKEETK